MFLPKTITLDTIADFEKIINKDGILCKSDTQMLAGTLAGRYRGMMEEGFFSWIRTRFHLLFIVSSGSSKVYIGDNAQQVVADHLVIVPENLPYFIEDLQQCEGYCLHFHSDFIRPVVNGHLSDQFAYFKLDSRHVFRLTDRESRLVQNCFKDIMRAYVHQSKEKEMLMRDFLHILLLHIRSIYNTFSVSVPESINRSSILVTRFIHFVEQHYKEVHEVKQYADLLNISPKYLTKIVKDNLGRSPQSYIHEMLLLEAKSLLMSTDKTVSEIAYELAFSDQPHFSHFIKKHTGKTPLELRHLK